MKLQEKFMKRCIQLATNGLGSTYPNPLVGAVIVRQGTIIGEGWHYRAGEPHAEVLAVNQVKEPAMLKEATLYVNLEPCSHHGRTPPCADLICDLKIPRVVVGSVDPNPEVEGRGIQRLRNAGCEVVSGVLQKECDELNKRFFSYHRKKRPWIILKWAETADGFMAPAAHSDNSGPVWISNSLSRRHAHKLRASEGAILVGSGTVLKDNPSLTTRFWEGPNPLRVVLDPDGKLPADRTVLDQSVPTLYVSRGYRSDIGPAHQLVLREEQDSLSQLFAKLYDMEIQSLLVEGGRDTLQGFIDRELWDEAFVYRSTKNWGDGLSAPRMKARTIGITHLGEDTLTHLKPTRH